MPKLKRAFVGFLQKIVGVPRCDSLRHIIRGLVGMDQNTLTAHIDCAHTPAAAPQQYLQRPSAGRLRPLAGPHSRSHRHGDGGFHSATARGRTHRLKGDLVTKVIKNGGVLKRLSHFSGYPPAWKICETDFFDPCFLSPMSLNWHWRSDAGHKKAHLVTKVTCFAKKVFTFCVSTCNLGAKQGIFASNNVKVGCPAATGHPADNETGARRHESA